MATVDWITNMTFSYIFSGFLIGLLVGHVVQVIRIRESFTSRDSSRSRSINSIRGQSKLSNMTSMTSVNKTTRKPHGGRLLCWVLISPAFSERIRLINQTWGKRCDVILYMTGVMFSANGMNENSDTSATWHSSSGSLVSLNISEGHRNLWGKTRAALSYVYHSHGGATDWFLKADDDTFVVVDNLRQFLNEHDPAKPLYFGQHITTTAGDSYMSGGAGYVLSRAALQRLITQSIHNSSSNCRQDPVGNEDLELGRCLSSCGVEMGSTKDLMGLDRFTSSPLHDIRSGSCSDHVISFHPIPAKLMSTFEYFIYRLQRKEYCS